jgi:hypothetical protein
LQWRPGAAADDRPGFGGATLMRSKFRPVSSPVGGTVMIVGKRLSHATAVAFDGIQATITSNSSTRIRAVVPTGATSGPICVVTDSGSATVSGFVVD